ncbi:MAG: SCO family protein [Rhodobacteraceae bacterium]|nr:SCO family protein [Paracoccaceae bacterium]
MQDRRVFVATAAALALGAAMPLRAQNADLGADNSDDAQPVRRRYLMEDVYGNVVTDADLFGQFVLIYFGYTGCPDVCPTSLSTITDVMEQLGDGMERLTVLFVTVDPDRDTAKVLREYVGFFDDRIIALRGPKAYTDHMVKAFNARYEIHIPDPDRPDDYAVDHTASIAFVGPDGALIRRFPHGLAADDITTDIRASMAAVPAN